jgi:DNA gyrase/topoisomerase IV subunit A
MKQRCKVAIDRTKDPEKKSNLKEAFEVWSNFLEDMKEKTEKLKNENLLVGHDLERVDEGFSDFYKKVKDNINSFDLKERIKEKISDLTETALKNTSNEKLKNELENVRVEFEKLPNEEKQKIKSKLKTFFKEEKNENRTTDKESEELKVKKPKKEKKYNTLTNQILDYFGLSMTSIGFVGSVVSMILTVMGKGLQEVVLNMEVGEIGGVFMVMTLLGGVIKGLFGKIDD